MAYAREGEFGSEVYVWSDGEHLHCECHKRLVTPSREAMMEHLHWHEERGNAVPDRAFVRLQWEIEHWGDAVTARGPGHWEGASLL